MRQRSLAKNGPCIFNGALALSAEVSPNKPCRMMILQGLFRVNPVFLDALDEDSAKAIPVGRRGFIA
jgi:hypothetical protein